MKFDFATEIKGMKKVTENGISKVFEGATINFEAEANVEEIIQLLKDKQLGVDKLLGFIRTDLPKSIKDCGSALLSIEKQNRILNAEMPSKTRKELIEENHVLQERVDKMSETINDQAYQIDSATRDCRGTSEAYQELQKKYEDLNKKYEYLKKRYVEENGEEEYTELNKVKKIF